MVPARTRRRSKPPQGATDVNWGNPITRGLVLASAGDQRFNAVDHKVSTGISVKRYSSQGAYMKGDGTTVGVDFSASGLPSVSRVTLMCLVESGPTGFLIGATDGVTFAGVSTSGDGGFSLFTTLTADRRWNMYGVVSGNATLNSDLYLNGVKEPSPSVQSASGNPPSGIVTINVGNGLPKFPGNIAFSAVWYRELSAAEIKAVTDNPWQIFNSRKQLIWYLAPKPTIPTVLPRTRSKRRARQPQEPVRVDWANPMTKGLALAQVGDSRLNAVTGEIGSGTFGAGVHTSAFGDPNLLGMARCFQGNADSGITFNKLGWSSAPTAVTIMVAADALSGGVLASIALPGGGYIRLAPDAVECFATSAKSRVGAGSPFPAVTAGVVPNGATSCTFYVNGNPTGSALNGTVTFPAGISRVDIGQHFDTSGSTVGSRITGDIAFVGIWLRELSAAEIKALSKNPWQIFKAQKKPLWTPIISLSKPTLHLPTRSRQRRNSPPPGPARIDWSNPITKGMTSFYLLRAGMWDLDLVTGKRLGFVDTAGATFWSDRIVTEANSILALPHNIPTFPPGFSFVSNMELAAGVWSCLNTGTASRNGFAGSAEIFVTYANDVPDGVATVSATGYPKLPIMTMVNTMSPTRITSTISGVLAEDTAFTIPPSYSPNVYLGGLKTNTVTGQAVSTFKFFATFSRALSDAEAKSLSLNPWQLLKARKQPIWAIVSAIQLLAPSSDIITGGWQPSTGLTLNGVLKESSPNSADYVFTTWGGDYAEIGLGSALPPISKSSHVLSYRIEPGVGTVTIALKVGSLIIASWTHTLTGSVQNITQTLSLAEANSITDYSNLRVSLLS